MKLQPLPIAVFVCGAVVMAFELAGSRVMAPAVGTSLIVWTSLIGIILASLSTGYWLGGRAADRTPHTEGLARVIAWSGVAIAATALLHTTVVSALSIVVHDIRVSAVIGSVVLFAPAAVLLGMVSPWAAKLSIRDLATDGAAVGTLAALSTAGSIAGTFLAGFVLISLLGTSATLVMLSLVTAGTALLLSRTRRVAMLAAVVAVAAVASMSDSREAGGALSIDTRYQRAFVFDFTDKSTGRPARGVATDPFGTQGAVFTDGDGVVFRYIRFFRLVEQLIGPPDTALVIGGAAYSWPRDLLQRSESTRVTTVELDPGMTAIARKHFGLTDDERLTIVHEDGRVFLNRTDESFDAVFLDAFSGMAVPFQLLTHEAITRVHTIVGDDGILMANLIGAMEGEKSGLPRAAYATIASVFPYVYAFPLGTDDDPYRTQNIVLLASNHDLSQAIADAADPLERGTVTPWAGDFSGGAVLTDDHAPVEALTMSLFR